MASFDVQWTESAVRDLEEIVTYIAQDSPMAARRVLQRLRSQAAQLEDFPMRGRLVPEFQDVGIRVWREVVVKPWRLLYRVAGNRVLVECVIDSRRDTESLLFDRLLRS